MGDSGRLVLIVDDDEDIRIILRCHVEAHGDTVIEATDGAEAIELISRVHPTLVLLDLRMPAVDGWQVLDWLRTQADRPEVVVMSAQFSADVLRDVERYDVDSTLAKPFDIDSVERLLAS